MSNITDTTRYLAAPDDPKPETDVVPLDFGPIPGTRQRAVELLLEAATQVAPMESAHLLNWLATELTP